MEAATATATATAQESQVTVDPPVRRRIKVWKMWKLFNLLILKNLLRTERQGTGH